MSERPAHDPRLTPAREDLAALHLEGEVEAERYAAGTPMRVTAPVAPLLRRPEGPRGLDTELLLGEPFTVYEIAEGWAWGQAGIDGYVGYTPEAALGPDGPAPTHRVAGLMAHLYPEPDIKTRPLATLSLGARLALAGESGGFAEIEGGGFIIARHLAPLDAPAPDWVAEAGRFLGIPYLWGGRSAFGIDCSGLVQLALQAAGCDSPRDSDMQEADLGATLAPGTGARRGDLLFWRGHVGVMLDETRLLHANAHHMAVAVEPLDAARARIEAAGGGPVTRHARLDAAQPGR